ncbi:MAG: hypothetical protein ACR2F1_12085 [Nitrososphaeraceae archaeon]
MNPNKNGKLNDDFPKGDNLFSVNKYKNITNFPKESDLREEIKALQRSMALLRQDLPQVVRSELYRLKGDL